MLSKNRALVLSFLFLALRAGVGRALVATEVFKKCTQGTLITHPIALHSGKGGGSSSGNGRKLLSETSSSSKCVWYSEPENCELDYASVAEVFSASKNDFAQYMSRTFTCMGIQTEDDCHDEDVCYWEENAKGCVFGGFAQHYKDSPCVTAAPATFAVEAATIVCQKTHTSSECQKTSGCYWYDDEDTCVADLYSIYFGVESIDSFLDEALELVDSKVQTITDIFFATYNTNSDFFQWTRALDWDVPKTSCPKGANTTVCEYIDASIEIVVPITIYCSGQYGYYSILGCSSDPLCDYNFITGCSVSNATITKAGSAAVNTLLPYIQNESDLEILSAIELCPAVDLEKDCTGRCVWNEIYGYCYGNQTYINAVIAAPRKETKEAASDPVCKYFGYAADSDCDEISSYTKCNNKSGCEWKLGERCEWSNEEAIEAAAENADDLDVSSEDLWKDCTGFYSERTCKAA